MRYVAGGNVIRSAIAMQFMIVKEDIRCKTAQKIRFIHATKEQRFVEANIPFSKGSNHPFMGWGTARRH